MFALLPIIWKAKKLFFAKAHSVFSTGGKKNYCLRFAFLNFKQEQIGDLFMHKYAGESKGTIN